MRPLTLLVLLGFLAPAAAAVREETAAYRVEESDATGELITCLADLILCPPPPPVFPVESGETVVLLWAVDTVPTDVAVTYRFERADTAIVAQGWFCGTATVAIPAGSARVVVEFPVLPGACPLPATHGTMHARFSG